MNINNYPESLFWKTQKEERALSEIVLTDSSLGYHYYFIDADVLGHFDGAPMVPLYVIMGHCARGAQVLHYLLNGENYINPIPMVTEFSSPRFAYRNPRPMDRVTLTSNKLPEEPNGYKVRLKGKRITAQLKFKVELKEIHNVT